jgi:vitamin B12 transporter
MSSYTTINANLDYDLSENITLNTKIENLFDKDYETTDGYNTPGQSFYIGMKYTGF